MRSREWTLRSRRVVTPSGTRGADVVIRRETIVAVLEYDDPCSEGVILDAGDLAVLPGLVAFHRDGRGQLDRGLDNITRDAAAGGVTTLIDLPLGNDLGFNRIGDLKTRMEKAEGKIRVDCGLVATLGPCDSQLLEDWIESGVVAIETSLESAFGSSVTPKEDELREACCTLARLDRPLLVHGAADGMEKEAVCRLIKLCRETKCRVHLVNPKRRVLLPMIAEARAEGLQLTIETSASKSCSSVKDLPGFDRSDPPRLPERSQEDGEWLWDGLRSRSIDSIGLNGDGQFSTPSNSKPGDDSLTSWENPWLKHGLTAIWSEARHRGLTLDDLARWTATHPSLTLGLATRKGSVLAGLDADFVVFDPDSSALIDRATDDRKCVDSTPDRPKMKGRVEATILRGTMIYQDGRHLESPSGAVVLRLEETLPIHHITP